MDDNRQEPQRSASDKKPSAAGGSTLWLVVGVVLVILIAASLIRSPYRVELPLTELRRLITLGAPDPIKNPDPSITIVENRGKSTQRTVKYSDLDVQRIGPERITGFITRQVTAPADQAAAATANVPFSTDCWGVEEGNANLMDLLFEKGFKGASGENYQTFWRNYGPLVLFLLIMLPFFVIMMRRISGVGGAMAFGRSRGKLFAQEDIEETFNDVAGIDEAVDELREVVEFLKNPDKYRVLGGRIPKGVLLVGPPGTGKTLLARAIAGEAGVPFFSLSGSDFVEMFVGVGAARVRDLFQQAESKAPCIVFIDELDALGKTRGSSIVGGHDEREQTLNALLVEMDGFSPNSGTIVMAATNRPETLDPALLRSGRFDRQVLVDRPDVRGREAILKVHVKNVKLNENVDLRKVAAITSGFVGADLANLVNEAALLAARNGKSSVTMVEFNEAVERVTAGLEKRQRLIQEDEKQRVAYHESAHALVAYSLPNTDPVHKVSIIPRGLAALGYTLQRPEGDRYLMTQSELESRIQVLLAGTVAEEIVFEDVSTGAQNDLERATEIARRMVMEFGMSRLGRVAYRETPANIFLGGAADMPRDRHYSERTAREIDEEIRRIIDESLEHVRHILEARHLTLIALATRLIEKEVIDFEELKQIVEEASSSPQI
ncbi:MAG: ATP-dependent zinc metalloprotease FtsH, partial [Thermoguttaceae bacterium]